jgi:hypothetical protein
MNQCAFRRSDRNLPLNGSMKLLSVGLPGREKSSVAVAHACLADFLDPLLQLGLTAALRLVDIERTVDPQRRTGAPGRHLPFAP